MSLQIQKSWIVIGLAGVLGALSRWSVSVLTESMLALPVFVDTVIVNILGCFALGIAFQMVPSNELVKNHMKDISAGFIGSFTTFSTFIADSYLLLMVSHPFIPGFLLIGQIVLGLIGFQLGLRVIKREDPVSDETTVPTTTIKISE